MDLDDLDIYDDLEEFHEEEKKKSNELLALEAKCNELLQTIENVKLEKKEMRKKLKTMEVNFQSLLDTAKAEILRKDKQILQLRKEKDDICFRRKKPVGGHEHEVYNAEHQFGMHANPFKQNSHYIPVETIVAEPDDANCPVTELPVGLPAEKSSDLVQYPTNHLHEHRGRVRNRSRDYHQTDNKIRAHSRDHERDHRPKRESSHHRRHESGLKSAKRPHSSERRDDSKRDIRERKAFKREDLKSDSQRRVRDKSTHSDRIKRESSLDKKEKFRDGHTTCDKIETECSKSNKSSSKEKTCANEKEKHMDTKKKEKEKNVDTKEKPKETNKDTKDKQKVKESLEQKQTSSIDIEKGTKITKSDQNESKETPIMVTSNKTEVVDSENSQKNESPLPVANAKNDHHEVNRIVSPTKNSKTTNKSERVDENSNLAMTEPILNTPKKVAIFDALFGSTPSSVESTSSSLLTNVRQILNRRGNESASTTPSEYTSAGEMSEEQYKPKRSNEKTKPCEQATAAENYVTADEITDESCQVADEINTKEVAEKVEKEVPNELPTKTVSKSEELAVTTSTLFGSTNAACIPALGDLVDCDVVEAVNKNKPISKIKSPLKPPQKLGFWIRKNEIIEIEDDTDVDESEDEKIEKVKNLTNDIEKNHTILEVVSSDEEKKSNEVKQLKNKIEIIENIRLPTLFNVQANVKTNETNELEKSALVDESKLTSEETCSSVFSEKEDGKSQALTNNTEKLQAKNHPTNESKDNDEKGEKEIIALDTIDITEDTNDSQYQTNMISTNESNEKIHVTTNVVLPSTEASQEKESASNTKSSNQVEKPLVTNSNENIESQKQSEAEVTIEITEEEEEEKSIEITPNSTAMNAMNAEQIICSNGEKSFDTKSNTIADGNTQKDEAINNKLVDSTKSKANESQVNIEVETETEVAVDSTESTDKVQLHENEKVEENEKNLKKVDDSPCTTLENTNDVEVEGEGETVVHQVLSENETHDAVEKLVTVKETENCLQENLSIQINSTDNINASNGNENCLNPSPKSVENDQRNAVPSCDDNSTENCSVEVFNKSETPKNTSISSDKNSSIEQITNTTTDKTESLDEAATVTVRIALHQLSALKNKSGFKCTNKTTAKPLLEDGVSFIVNNSSFCSRIEEEKGNEHDISKKLPKKRKLSMDEETVQRQKLPKVATVDELLLERISYQLEEREREKQKSVKVVTVDQLEKVTTPQQLDVGEPNSIKSAETLKCLTKPKKPSSHLKSPSEEDYKLKLKKEAAETLLQLQIVKEQGKDQITHKAKNEKTKEKLPNDKDVHKKTIVREKSVQLSERHSLKVSEDSRKLSKALESKNACKITMENFTKDGKKLKKSPSEKIPKAPKVTITPRSTLVAKDLHHSTTNKKISMNTMAGNSINKRKNIKMLQPKIRSTKSPRKVVSKPKLTQRRILDTTSEEEDAQPAKFKPTMNRGIVMANSTPKCPNTLKSKQMSVDVNCVDAIVQPKIDVSNTTLHNISDKILIPTPLISPSLHAIFQTETHMNDAAAITGMLPSMPGNSSRDAQFNEIDSRLESMFQSPPYALELSYKSDLNAPDTLLGIDAAVDMIATNTASTDVTIEETMDNSSRFDQSSLNDTDNSAATKHISLGSSDYRFEKISDNVVNLFITRKRRKKRKVIGEPLPT